jgi:hypothetical protein
MAKYASVRIQAAADTLVVWLPQEDHGTSLRNFDPEAEDPNFFQRLLHQIVCGRNTLDSSWICKGLLMNFLDPKLVAITFSGRKIVQITAVQPYYVIQVAYRIQL